MDRFGAHVPLEAGLASSAREPTGQGDPVPLRSNAQRRRRRAGGCPAACSRRGLLRGGCDTRAGGGSLGVKDGQGVVNGMDRAKRKRLTGAQEGTRE